MRHQRSAGVAVAALLATVFFTACTTQDQPEDEGQPSPSPSTAASIATADPVSGTYTGTTVIELGDRPPDVTHISVEIICLTPGTIFLHNGAEMQCAKDQTGPGPTSIWSLPLPAGEDSLEVKTSDPAVSYEAKVSYENN